MATVTGTGVLKTAPLKSHHAGVNAVYFEVSVSSTLAAPSNILMGKIPDRARIIDGYAIFPGPGSYHVGLFNQSPSGTVATSDTDILARSATGAGTAIRFFNDPLSTGHGHVVSITESNIVRHQILTITLSTASGTSSGKYEIVCQYIMDGDQGL